MNNNKNSMYKSLENLHSFSNLFHTNNDAPEPLVTFLLKGIKMQTGTILLPILFNQLVSNII
jgi:hypothetical protein